MNSHEEEFTEIGGQNSRKTSTSLRIGISVAMIIMMLGLAVFLNAVTTYTITNQMKALSDLNMPISQGITRSYAILQMQRQSVEDAITYHDLNSQKNYEGAKNQFDLYNDQWNYEIKKITNLIDVFPGYELNDDTSKNLSILSTNLNEIKLIHFQYEQNAIKAFERYDKDQKDDKNAMMITMETQQNQLSLKTILLNDEVQKLTDSLGIEVEQSKQKSFTLQIVIITSTGIMSLALGYFLNLINKDLVREVIRKTRSLQNANKKLQRMNVLKDDFINIASHELKSPLHPIYGFVELAQNGDIGKDEALAGISKQARQLEEVANRILDISRINNGTLQLSYEKFDLTEMINEMVSSYKVHLDENITIETSLENGIEIEADRVRIGQVIRNLVNNAIKFTPHGTIRITSQHSLQKNIVEITISDNGSGIHPEILPNLFNKFITRGPKEDSWKGNGLGLYLSREIINAHGGHIVAYNNKDAGATFKFTVPIMKHMKATELQNMVN